MENIIITIPIQTSMDLSQLLSIVQELAEQLKDDIESYDEEVDINEDEICVASGE